MMNNSFGLPPARWLGAILIVALVIVVALVLAGFGTGDQCKRTISSVDSAASDTDPLAVYDYEELSANGQRAVRIAIQNGSYQSRNADDVPSAFRYWDTETIYGIEWNGDRYHVRTFGAGCGE